MDEKDVRIFCEIAFRDLSYSSTTQRHVSPTEIGRKLGLDEKTVRTRIAAMEKDGFIKYYQAMPSLALFDKKVLGLYRLEAMNIHTKHKVIQSVPEIPGIVEAIDYLGPKVSVDLAGESPDSVKAVADQVARRFELTPMSLGLREVRPITVRVDRLDWQLIKELRYDARMTTTAIAKDLSITPRMAEYRIEKLLDDGALLIRAVVNTQKQAGLVFYELEISMDEAKKGALLDALKKTFEDKFWNVSSPSPGLILANLFGFTLGEPEDAALSVSKLPGVRYCHLLILKETIEPKPSWADRLIDEKIAA
ncbi:MAG: Lrp/AsnC family transcriptional regulator [archaeon]|nr:MAG: Lrp/AsnC family transcriptional regulator [archaeon]